MILISGSDQTSSRLPGPFSLFLPGSCPNNRNRRNLHRAIETRFAGTVAGTAPSTAHQIVLDLRPEARLSFAFEPPGYQLHYWREGGGLVTDTAAIGDWPGPYFYSKKSAPD